MNQDTKLTKPLIAWLLFTAAGIAGVTLYYLWLTIERIVMHPESLIALIGLVIVGFDMWTDRPMPFLAIDRELRYAHSALAATMREMAIPLLVLGVIGWGAYRIFWQGDLRGLIPLGAVWLADVVIAWSVRNHRWWLAARRSHRQRPKPAAMLDTDTTNDAEETR